MTTNTPTYQVLLDQLSQLAREHLAALARADAAGESRAANAFNAVLARLESDGWDGALGEVSELPDQLLPVHYLQRRARLLGDLEDRLGRLAMAYRDAPTDSAAAIAVQRYRETMAEMYRIGHWHGVPDPDSQLPLDDMPDEFRARRQERIRRRNAAKGNS